MRQFGPVLKNCKVTKHYDQNCSIELIKDNDGAKKVKEKYDDEENLFSLTLFSKENLLKAIKSLPNNKVSFFDDSLINVLKN